MRHMLLLELSVIHHAVTTIFREIMAQYEGDIIMKIKIIP